MSDEKCQALRALEKSLFIKGIAEKCNVPRNTISTWVKNKSKYFAALEQSLDKRRKLRSSESFLSKRSQNMPIDGVSINEDALQYAKELILNEFTASDGSLHRWKER